MQPPDMPQPEEIAEAEDELKFDELVKKLAKLCSLPMGEHRSRTWLLEQVIARIENLEEVLDTTNRQYVEMDQDHQEFIDKIQGDLRQGRRDRNKESNYFLGRLSEAREIIQKVKDRGPQTEIITDATLWLTEHNKSNYAQQVADAADNLRWARRVKELERRNDEAIAILSGKAIR